ncbi:uncharacterized protein TNCV_1623391 [Trichonephila clavipes]|nr:uncharacterized protein TNCV_1623391 [Trichonephila clavipes]
MKALKFYKELKESEPSTSSRESNPQFSASTGWLTGFLKRHSFHNLKIKGEVASADEEAARKYPEKLAKIIKDGEYCAHQVFNADETGLFWKKKCQPVGKGFDDFGEHDIEELLVDEALNDDDILESMVDITKDLETVDSEPEEDVTPLDEKLLREGLQLSGNLDIFFIQNDNDVERALKFQRDLKFCMSGYRELYKELVPSQSLITDYLVKEKKITEVPEEALPCRSDDVILSSSDESDLAPITNGFAHYQTANNDENILNM